MGGVSILDVLLGNYLRVTWGLLVSRDARGGSASLCWVSRASKTASLPSASRETSSRRATWKGEPCHTLM